MTAILESTVDAIILSALIGIAVTVVGYWLTTFFMPPILRYKNIRDKILRDFIYYAQVINPDRVSKKLEELYHERVLANRKTSAELTDVVLNLPRLYLSFLNHKGQEPAEAARNLMGFSNEIEYDKSRKIEIQIRKQLGLPEE